MTKEHPILISKDPSIAELQIQVDNLWQKIDQTLPMINDALDKTNHVLHDSNQEHISTINTLQNSIDRLGDKFDVWQSNVEPMLAASQTAMAYDNYVMTFLAIVLTIAGIFFQFWAQKSKKEAVSEAINDIDSQIAKGILPEGSGIREKIISSILNSEEFVFAVKKANEFIDTSEREESKSSAPLDNEPEKTTSNVTLGNIETARASDENNNTDEKSNAKVTKLVE